MEGPTTCVRSLIFNIDLIGSNVGVSVSVILSFARTTLSPRVSDQVGHQNLLPAHAEPLYNAESRPNRQPDTSRSSRVSEE